MAGAMLVTLTFATLASGAQYVDYSGVKMPEYGGHADYDGPRDVPAKSDDYHDHPPDAPAPLDYKYEEDVNGKTKKVLMKDLEETEDWQKPQKKQRRPTRPIDDLNIETLDKYSPDEIVPKFKASHRFSKHRPRLKARNSDRADSVGPKRPVNYVRIRDTEMSDIDSKDDFRDDKVDEFEDDQSSFVYTETTMRVARRKPRDRFVKNRRGGEDLQRERDSMETGNLIGRRLIPKDEMGRNLKYQAPNEEEPGAPLMFRNPSNPYATSSDEEDPALIRPMLNQKDDAEYSEYYDMNRVNNIKNKLPSLLRRTTTARTPAPTRRKTKLLLPYDVKPPGFRRVNAFAPFPEPDAEKTTTETTTTSKMTTTTTTTSAPTTTTTTTERSIEDKIALSIAEKSRLSILKKAQRKENSRNETSTKKPLVLLQVTNVMQTVVMVEPPTEMEPWVRAKEVSGDTQERLNKVKRLMRHKLVANAKNMQELTDNWDDMICDYVDVSLIDSAANSHCVSVVLIFTVILLGSV